MTIETATITVPKIRDNDGQPTCRWWDQHCPFLMQSGFGTREHCFWMEGSGKHRPQLERREHGIGITIPHPCCPVWEVQPCPGQSGSTPTAATLAASTGSTPTAAGPAAAGPSGVTGGGDDD